VPVLLPTNQPPYDTADYVLGLVRVILGDWIQNSALNAGDIFADGQSYVYPTLNLAWRTLQRKAALAGHARLEPRTVITALPVVNNTVAADPAAEVYLSWSGFNDGVNLITGGVVLPQDLMFPIKLGERQTSTLYQFAPMHPATDGLPSVPAGSWYRWWEWRAVPNQGGEALYMKGTVISMDLEMRYAAWLADIPASPSAPVPFMRCAEALAYYTAAAYVAPREAGPGKAEEFEQSGDKKLAELLALPAKQILQRATYRRIPAIKGRRWRWR
jgi:hypothetical protein